MSSEKWKTLRITSSGVEIIDGDRGINYPKQDEFLDNGYCLFLNTSNVTKNGFSFEKCQFITKEKDESLRKGKLKRNDIVLTTRGTVGNVAFFNESVKLDHLRINSGMVILRANPKIIDNNFLYQFLNSGLFSIQVKALSSGSAQPQLPIRDLSQIEISLPPIIVQRRVAAILTALDDKIELNRRMNETLESMAQAVWGEWFGKYAGGEELPEGWKWGKLGDVASTKKGQIKPEEMNDEVLHVGLEHIARKSLSLTDWGTAGKLESNKFRFSKGDILFGKLRPYFHKVCIAPFDGVCSTDILVIEPKAPEWYAFVVFHFFSNELIAFTTSTADGTRMPRTNWGDLANFEIAIPPKPLASNFNEIVNPIFMNLIENIHQSRTLTSLRDALLPQLMRGKINL